MQANYHIAMVSHQEISLDELGGLSVKHSNDDGLFASLKEIKTALAADELYYLNTCNRVLFLVCRDQSLTDQEKESLFNGRNPSDIKTFSGKLAIQHLFEVASSIHSLVIGEREIIKQIRDAYEKQLNHSLSGDRIRLLIEQTIRTAKKIYANTRIGEKPVSVVSLAVKKFLAFNLPLDAKFLFVGAGDSIELMHKHLSKKGYRDFTVFNRTEEHAKTLAAKIGGTGSALDQLKGHTEKVHCVVACTGAQDPTVLEENLPASLKDRISEVVWIDLGLPADLDSAIIDAAGAKYLGLDSLKSLAKENLSFRVKEVTIAQDLLAKSLLEFEQLLELRQIELAFKGIPAEIKTIKEKALLEVFAKEMETLDENSISVIKKMMDYMERKCIGIPMKVAKEVALKN